MKDRIEDLQRRLAEAEAELERHRLIVESTSDGVVRVDTESRITSFNPRFREILGYDEDELRGRSLHSMMDAPSERLSLETREKRIQGVRNVIDLKFRTKDGSEVDLSFSGAPLFDRDRKYIGSLAIVRDVTEQKRIAARMMFQDRLASVGTLTGGVAHEINNPLAIVVANLSHLDTLITQAGSGGLDPSEEVRETLGDARDAAERVRLIVRDLLVFSRSSSEGTKGPVDVRAIVESAIRMAMGEIRPRARLVVLRQNALPPVFADEARLGQVFLDLLVNAAQSIQPGRPEEEEIVVSTRTEGSRVIVDVRDTGTGIPPESLGRIFEPFFTTKPQGAGMGLGLAVSHRIVTDLGGDLTVESTVGKGSNFRVSLPVAAGPAIRPGVV